MCCAPSDDDLTEIVKQLEFYFSDSNLSKDRQMMNLLRKDDLSISLSDLQKFNRLRQLCHGDPGLIVRAAKESRNLAVQEADGESPCRIKRNAPFTPLSQEKMDRRTIYVECKGEATKEFNREKLFDHFSRYGKVTYISVPIFKSTGDSKGYAFVEFAKTSDAKRALRGLSGDVTRVFVQGNKQLLSVRRQLRRWGIDATFKRPTPAGSDASGPFIAISKKSWVMIRDEHLRAQRYELKDLRSLLSQLNSCDKSKEVMIEIFSVEQGKQELVSTLKESLGNESVTYTNDTLPGVLYLKLKSSRDNLKLTELLGKHKGRILEDQVRRRRKRNIPDHSTDRDEPLRNDQSKRVVFSDSSDEGV